VLGQEIGVAQGLGDAERRVDGCGVKRFVGHVFILHILFRRYENTPPEARGIRRAGASLPCSVVADVMNGAVMLVDIENTVAARQPFLEDDDHAAHHENGEDHECEQQDKFHGKLPQDVSNWGSIGATIAHSLRGRERQIDA
jgi:hypothetical protein